MHSCFCVCLTGEISSGWKDLSICPAEVSFSKSKTLVKLWKAIPQASQSHVFYGTAFHLRWLNTSISAVKCCRLRLLWSQILDIRQESGLLHDLLWRHAGMGKDCLQSSGQQRLVALACLIEKVLIFITLTVNFKFTIVLIIC